MMSGIAELPFTIAELQRAYATGLSPVDVVAEVFRRLAVAADPGIFISVGSQGELSDAAEALGSFDPARPLWGIPVAVKDNIDVADLPTTAACPDYAYQPEVDAFAVARLRAAGALIVGKTNLDQFATGLVGVRTPYPVPRNPLDASLVPGGSSSGSAVAVARGIVAIALGTDTAGSGRVPAALNNIVGLKPSLGSVSTRGVVPACRTLDCVSVFAFTVEDAWTAYRAIAGFDAADPYSRSAVPTVARHAPICVGIPRIDDRIFDDAAGARAYNEALAHIEDLGAELSFIDFAPFLEVAALLYDGPWLAERYAAVGAFMEERPDSVHPTTRAIIARGADSTGAAGFAGFYRLEELRRAIEPVWSSIDALCVPTIPGPVSLSDIAADPVGPNSRLGTYTNFVNLLRLCALAVPSAARADGLPCGVTLIGPDGADAVLAELGHRLQIAAGGPSLGATDWPLPLRAWHPPPEIAGGIPIAVFGAHLAGLQLNHQLLSNGGVLLRPIRTAADYRMYRVPGMPARPGLIRIGDDEGVEIDGELWLLPPEGFGRFVALIGPPLSIGTVRLQDGEQVKGFLAESRGVEGAEDISHFGGWRPYLQAEERQQVPAK